MSSVAKFPGGRGAVAIPRVVAASAASRHPRVSRPIVRLQVVVGYLTIAVFAAIFAFWSWAAPLSTAAIAPGQVMAEGNRRVVQHLEGGILRDFLVRDGDAVEAGQVLLRLDDSQSGAQSDLLRGQLDSLLALDARLTAELAEADAIAWPASLAERRADPRVAEALAGQEAIFANHRRAYEGQLSILRQRVTELNEEIKGLEGQVAGLRQQASLLSGEINDTQGLVDKGYAPRPRLLALQREHARVSGDRDRTLGQIARSRQTIGETELQIAQIRNTFLNEAAGEQRDNRQKIAEARERLRAASDVQQRREVTAPTAGTVANLRFHTLGGVVRAGEALLDIVPRDEALVVESRISPNDIDIVALGQPAEVRLTSFKQRVVPLLQGHVTYVAADLASDERSNGTPYYRATVQIDAGQLALLSGLKLTPGMPAEVMIHAGERTLAEFLFQPIRDSFRRAFREP